MVTKVWHGKDILQKGIADPRQAVPDIKALATSDDWSEREVAATALVKISKKQPDKVVAEMLIWSTDRDPNVRRTASEALRYLARKRPADILPVLENLKTDSNLYVRKSVANVLRNAGNYDPDFVLNVCSRCAALRNTNTKWIIKDGLRKLKTTRASEVDYILKS